MTEKKTPKVLDEFVDKVLAYKPKPRSKAAKKRAAQTEQAQRPVLKRAAD
jgi:hypothetical protein